MQQRRITNRRHAFDKAVEQLTKRRQQQDNIDRRETPTNEQHGTQPIKRKHNETTRNSRRRPTISNNKKSATPYQTSKQREGSPSLGAGTLTHDERNKLLEHYYNIDNPTALTSSAKRLYNALRAHIPSLTLAKCQFFLQTQSPYTLTAPRHTHIQRNPMEVHRCFDILAGDIMILRRFADTTEIEAYCLLIVDVFSRYAWYIILKTRTATEITEKFEKLLEELRPRLLKTTIFFDRESAIISRHFRTMLRKFDVQLQLSYTETKVSHAEVLIRYLRRSLFVYKNL